MNITDDLNEIFEKMPAAFVSEKANGLNAAIQLELTGESAGDWFIKIANGTATIEAGRTSTPNLTLTMTTADYIALSLGDASPVNLFMAGKIKAQGDMTLAMKFPNLFDKSKV